MATASCSSAAQNNVEMGDGNVSDTECTVVATIGLPSQNQADDSDLDLFADPEDSMDSHPDNFPEVPTANCDKDDIFLQAALAASSGDDSMLALVLRAVRNQNVIGNLSQTILVKRSAVWESAKTEFLEPSFKCTHDLCVEFSGEMANDYGGPKREFWRLLLKEMVQKSGLFTGEGENIALTHNVAHLQNDLYGLAGQIMAMSLLQGGPGLGCLSQTMYHYMTSDKPQATLDVFATILPCTKADGILNSLKNCTDSTEFKKFVTKEGEWFVEHGYPNIYTAKVCDIEAIVTCVVEDSLKYRISSEVKQFFAGMDSVYPNFSRLIKLHPQLFKPIFTATFKPLTRDAFRKLVIFQRSPEMSNKARLENETIYGWDRMLLDIANNKNALTFGSLLQFITGADRIPPLEFNNLIRIKFIDKDANPRVRRLPYSSTCELTLTFCRGVVNVGQLMEEAIASSPYLDKA